MRRYSRILLLLVLPVCAVCFPFFSWTESPGAQSPEDVGSTAEQIPCPEHRPLPPIDPVEGLSWLDHVSNLSAPCFAKVNFGWDGISDADAPRLVRMIEAGVQTLVLYQNQLGDEAASQLALALPESNVHEIDLSHNQVGDKGAEAIANALATAPLLRTVRLNANDRIGDAGVTAFTHAIVDFDVALQELWIASPRSGKEAKDALREAWHGSGRDPGLLHL
eukprot:CAMPEP_0119297920 /NCGR_PEP_ID=MMETSP1333-20130426/116_1 /TAXON_ID=418940 /ORGANISM="Scyphosphaera apsteinii, Strain RCC1455" /LENGTH=220 /DNA_ID=CAMNT_0007298883 /DNA_START=115 /DNA_END=777 /DNA_ORIENTATION=+